MLHQTVISAGHLWGQGELTCFSHLSVRRGFGGGGKCDSGLLPLLSGLCVGGELPQDGAAAGYLFTDCRKQEDAWALRPRQGSLVRESLTGFPWHREP